MSQHMREGGGSPALTPASSPSSGGRPQVAPLKACPFCGGEANVREYPASRVVGWPRHPDSQFGVDCSNCGAEIGKFMSDGPAIDLWNERADELICEELFEVLKLAVACEPADWEIWHQQALDAIARVKPSPSFAMRLASARVTLNNILACSPHIRGDQIIYDCGNPFELARQFLATDGKASASQASAQAQSAGASNPNPKASS